MKINVTTEAKIKTPEQIKERIEGLEKALTIIGEQSVKDDDGKEFIAITMLWNLIVKEINSLNWVLNKTR